MKYLQKNSLGFTLIELLIVIAILGILATIAVPYYGNYVQRAKVAGAASVVGAWQVAVEQCILDRGWDKKNECVGGVGLIPVFTPTKFVQNLTVSDGKIEATTTGVLEGKGSEMKLTYTPVPDSGYIKWTLSGSGCKGDSENTNPARAIDCNLN